jgi:hypothetical protein
VDAFTGIAVVENIAATQDFRQARILDLFVHCPLTSVVLRTQASAKPWILTHSTLLDFARLSLLLVHETGFAIIIAHL